MMLLLETQNMMPLLEHYPPVLPHQRKIPLYQLVELFPYHPMFHSHHQHHVLAQTEPIQHVIDSVPPAHMVLTHGLKDELDEGDGNIDDKFGEDIRGDCRESFG